MKEIKKFYTGVFFVAALIFCAVLIGQKIADFKSRNSGQGDIVFDSDFGNFLAAQHALSVNDFNRAAQMASMVKAENKTVADTQNLADFFNGKLPKNADKFKDSKDLVHGLIYDAFLIQKMIGNQFIIAISKIQMFWRHRCVYLLGQSRAKPKKF